MTGLIYLIGGGEIREGETRQIDDELLSLASTGSTLVFFGFASYDNVGYASVIETVFGGKFKILIATEKKGRQYAIDAIKAASVIYIGGGDTDHLLHLFSQWGITEHLATALKKGVHIAGMSAGALALSAQYIHEDDGKFEIKEGWGFVPIGVQVHAHEDSWVKAGRLWKDSHMSREYPFFAIGERAALCVDTDGQHKVGGGPLWSVDKDA